jgi:RecA-family ATPase
MTLPPAYEVLRRHGIRFVANAPDGNFTSNCPEPGCGGQNNFVHYDDDEVGWHCRDCGKGRIVHLKGASARGAGGEQVASPNLSEGSLASAQDAMQSAASMQDAAQSARKRGGIPAFLTNDMKAKLRARGYSEEFVRTVKPEEAWSIIYPDEPEEGQDHEFADEGKQAKRPSEASEGSTSNDKPDGAAQPSLRVVPMPPPQGEPLPYVDMSTWDDAPAPLRQWLVLDRIPQRQPSLISGEGAIGKSILLLQLLVSTALSKPWIGSRWPKPGATIYLGAEDEADEIRRRLEPILEHHGARFSDLIAAGFKLLAYAGEDAVLAELDRKGRIQPTELFKQLYAEAVALKPSAIVIDPVSDVFLGDEIKRDQVRQFGSLMRRLAIQSNSGVVISAHPSLTGISSGSGLSGSTQWHNTVRARAYFKKPKAGNEDDDDNTPDSGRRELHFFKNQYGPLAHHIELKWNNGLWLPPSATDDAANAEAQMDDLFLILLRRFTAQGRDVSAKQSPTYAPAKFAEQPEAKKLKASRHAMAAAMERLFAAGKIKIVTDGPPSKRRSKLVEVNESDQVELPDAIGG